MVNDLSLSSPILLCQVPALVARYAGKPGLLQAVEAAVRAQQNNDVAVHIAQAAALLLERVVLVSSRGLGLFMTVRRERDWRYGTLKVPFLGWHGFAAQKGRLVFLRTSA